MQRVGGGISVVGAAHPTQRGPDRRGHHRDGEGLGRVVVALTVELARAGQLKPALVMLGHRLVEQRAFGVTRLVALGLGCSRHEYCANTQYFADFSSAGLRSKNASMMRFAYTTTEN